MKRGCGKQSGLLGEVSVDPSHQSARMFPLPEFSCDFLAGGCVGHQRRVVNFYGPLHVGDLTLASIFICFKDVVS